ncbi:hypothetical protein LG047_12005 [Methylocystis sp. WRRC1]|uniref:hypothetical protein n=1 Tax=unclassified Methylocystis TaxID=2625913 RepID=UPI0001F86B10|nr:MULTISPECIES: hypothetical protein [unclassified Methylocystis]MCC3246039.1 hypothetical protein [Methylocystis sp. WRRC1]
MMQQAVNQVAAFSRESHDTSISTAVYVAEMSEELSKIATRSGLPMVAYFLKLAELEAKEFLNEFDEF